MTEIRQQEVLLMVVGKTINAPIMLMFRPMMPMVRRVLHCRRCFLKRYCAMKIVTPIGFRRIPEKFRKSLSCGAAEFIPVRICSWFPVRTTPTRERNSTMYVTITANGPYLPMAKIGRRRSLVLEARVVPLLVLSSLRSTTWCARKLRRKWPPMWLTGAM